MKKIKILLISLVILLVVLSLAIIIAIKVFLPEDKIKSYITDYAKNNLNREVIFDKISFSLIGINLENFKMSEKSTFNEGTFIKADNFIIKVSPLPLLSKEIKISKTLLKSVEINITKDENGTFNFNDIVDITDTNSNEKEISQKKSSDNAQLKSFNINNFVIKDTNLNYTDKQSKLNANIKNLNLDIQDFSINDIFLCQTSFEISLNQNKLNISLPLNAKFKTNLNNFDMSKLFLDIETFETVYNGTTISLQGNIEGINVPKINCNIILKNISDKTFKDFFDCKTEFVADEITFKTKSTVNISSMNANIESLNLILPNSSSDISGTIDWSKQDLQYNLKLNLDLLADNFAKFVPEYNLTGRLKTNLSATQNFCEGTLSLENISSKSKFGDISNLNGKAYLKAENSLTLQKVDFKTLDIDSLIFNIKQLSLKYNDTDISLTGDLTKQQTPVLTLNLQSKNFSNDTLKNFYKCPIKFIFPSFNMDTVTSFNLKTNSANITKLDIKIPNSSADILGQLNWNNKKSFKYNLSFNLNLLLDNIAQNFPEYKMKGKIISNAKISNNDFSGNLSCSNVAFEYLPLATISKLNIEATAKSKKNITIKTVNGMFNNGKFEGNASLTDKDIKLNLNMDKLTIKTSTTSLNKETSKQKKQEKKSTNSLTDFNYNVYADIVIKEINVPYLTSKQATLKTALKSVTSTFTKATGTFDLTISTGTITNANKLTDNKIAKTILLLFNVINNSRTQETKANSDNDISFQNIICNVLFSDGLIKTKDVSIKVPTAKIIADGTVNLKNEALNLSVSAGNYTGMKVTGTMSDPKISYDVAKALSNILGDKSIGDTLKNLFK